MPRYCPRACGTNTEYPLPPNVSPLKDTPNSFRVGFQATRDPGHTRWKAAPHRLRRRRSSQSAWPTSAWGHRSSTRRGTSGWSVNTREPKRRSPPKAEDAPANHLLDSHYSRIAGHHPRTDVYGPNHRFLLPDDHEPAQAAVEVRAVADPRKRPEWLVLRRFDRDDRRRRYSRGVGAHGEHAVLRAHDHVSVGVGVEGAVNAADVADSENGRGRLGFQLSERRSRLETKPGTAAGQTARHRDAGFFEVEPWIVIIMPIACSEEVSPSLSTVSPNGPEP